MNLCGVEFEHRPGLCHRGRNKSLPRQSRGLLRYSCLLAHEQVAQTGQDNVGVDRIGQDEAVRI